MNNTSKKGTKRRLKKSIRKTFGGLFLASSIMVAAIPFPEAMAYDPASVAIPAYDVTSADYKTSKTEYKDLDYDSDTDFSNMGTGSVKKALIMSRTSVGSWQMDWQYEYWLPSEGANGYITSYNSQYSVEDIKLESRVYSDFVFLTQEDVEKFYNDDSKEVVVTVHSGDKTPTESDKKKVKTLKYKYTISDEYEPTREADMWLFNNFPAEVAEYRTAYTNYKNNIDPLTNEASVDYPKPDPLSKSVGDKYPTDRERVQFLCESVFGDGTPSTELITVDKRKYNTDGTIQWEKVLVPNIGMRPDVGTISIGGHSYYVDMDYFLCDTFATIVGVGKDAFNGVSNVKTMEMAKEISFIGDSAFEDSFLSTVVLSSDAKIGNRAFYNCAKLSSVEMPEGIRRIGAEAFYGCPLKEVVIPDSCTYIGPGAFANSGNLAGVVFASNGSTNEKTIGKYAFYDDLALNSVDFGPTHIISIGEAAFAVNNAETGNMTQFTFPSYIKTNGTKTDIGAYCLAGRDNLDYVTIPDNLDGNLDDTIFYLCTGLESVTFGENCYNMTYTSSTDGNGNKTNTMFYSVANPNFYVKGPKSNAAGRPASPRTSTWSALYDYAATGDVGRHVPYVYEEDGKEYYEVSDGNYLMVIDKATGELISCTFPSDKSPADIDVFTIPGVVGTTKVTGIKDGCFVGDTTNVGVLDYIINLVIEDGSDIKNLDENIFKGAKKLETVYIGDSVENIGNSAFEDCKNLAEVTIEKNISAIGDNAFQNCPKLENITFETPTDYSKFSEGEIGTNAFNTGGVKLTLHGELVEGYAPFEWATDKNNYANQNQSIRTLYKTPLPSGLSVILDNQNEMVTLVDYPHYEDLDRIAYDATENKLVELSAPPTSGSPYYGNTIMDKLNSADPNDALNYLEETMVYNCSDLVIPAGVESIDAKGFFNDSSQNPEGVKSYSNRASVVAYFNTSIAPYNSYAANGLFNGYCGDEGPGSDGPREYPSGDDLELHDQGNDRLENIVMYDVKYLPDNAFASCENLKTAYIGEGIVDVGARPFDDCTSLSSVAFGNSNYECNNGIIYKNNTNGSKTIVECLETRGKSVGGPTLNVSNDPDLTTVSSIDNAAFKNCIGLNAADFTNVNGLEEIPEECFIGCENLTEIDLPRNVAEIGDRAFADTGDYTKVTVRNKSLYLGDDSNGKVGEKVKTSYYVTYEDAPSRRTAKKQSYNVDQTLDDTWTVKFYDQTGKTLLYTEFVQDGKNAEGPEEELIPEIPGYKFKEWNQSLKNITSDCFRLAVYEPENGTDPGTTPGTTPGGSNGGTNGGGSNNGGSNNGGNNNGGSNNGGSGNGGSSNNGGGSSSGGSSSETAKKYRLNVVYGSGSGDYAADTTVIIEAIEAPAGKTFDKWVATGTTPTITSATSKATTVKMPAGECTITATYKDGDGSASRTSVSVGNRNGSTGNTIPGNSGTVVDIKKPGISNVDKAYASVNGSTDNFIVKVNESSDAANAVATALSQKYGDMSPIKYFAMDISLYDATGTNKITMTDGMSVNITMPIPDALVQYAGNNRVGAVSGTTLEDLPCKFVTVDGIPCVSFTATHFSPYTIYVDTSNLTYGTIDSTPKTGDGIHPKWFVSIVLFCCSMILFLKRDKVKKTVKTA